MLRKNPFVNDLPCDGEYRLAESVIEEPKTYKKARIATNDKSIEIFISGPQLDANDRNVLKNIAGLIVEQNQIDKNQFDFDKNIGFLNCSTNGTAFMKLFDNKSSEDIESALYRISSLNFTYIELYGQSGKSSLLSWLHYKQSDEYSFTLQRCGLWIYREYLDSHILD